MDIKIAPYSLNGSIDAIASKSYAHRALFCAASASEKSKIIIKDISEDIEATISVLRGLGSKIIKKDYGYCIYPIEKKEKAVLDVNESGTTFRFLLPYGAAYGGEYEIITRGRLSKRPIDDLIIEMKKKGVDFSSETPPFIMKGQLESGKFTLPGDTSSQYISAILLAGPIIGNIELEVNSAIESKSYIDITLEVMREFGIEVEKNIENYTILEKRKYIPREYKINGDWSNSSFFLVGAALNGEIQIDGLKNDAQGDREIIKVLDNFGAKIINEDKLIIKSHKKRSFDLDLRSMPDSLPVLAVLAAGANGISNFTNGKRLRYKESDRLKTTAQMIRDLGGKVEELEEGLKIYGTGSLKGGTTSSFNDHRLAMAAAIAGTLSEDEIIIQESNAVKKSYPDFFEDLKKVSRKNA